MSSQHRAALPLRTPGELIAAIPTLLGFQPTDSLVLILYTQQQGQHRVLGAVARIDLPQPEDVPDWIDQLRHLVVVHTPAAADLVVLCAAADPAMPAPVGPADHSATADLPFREPIEQLIRSLVETGTVVNDALWAAAALPGTWHCYHDTVRTGQIPDPATVPLVTALTVAGAVAYGSREEIATSLAPTPLGFGSGARS